MRPTGTKIFGWAAPGELDAEDDPVEPTASSAESPGEPERPVAWTNPAEPAAAPQLENHRLARRSRVLMDGKIAYAQGARSIDCTIRDLSETGARVRLAGPEPMPESVVLIQMRSGIAYEATVVWARDKDLGLTFIAAHHLDDACPPAMAPLRRLWLEHLPR
jgi:hypothetical protein